jgi:hypothetical protein
MRPITQPVRRWPRHLRELSVDEAPLEHALNNSNQTGIDGRQDLAVFGVGNQAALHSVLVNALGCSHTFRQCTCMSGQVPVSRPVTALLGYEQCKHGRWASRRQSWQPAEQH